VLTASSAGLFHPSRRTNFGIESSIDRYCTK
jgi:hypothetical protein